MALRAALQQEILMRRLRVWLLGIGLLGVAAAARAGDIAAIAYHDIVSSKNSDAYAVTLRDFERQMEYLASQGYHPVSLRALEEARQGKAVLPEKPVLLTFDDGLQSYYVYAYPILRRYGFPSVVSIVTSWIDGRSAPEGYATRFMTWDELREISRSPLVEVVSHTDDLHHGLPANTWGSRMPAAVTRVHDATSGKYETEEARARRVRNDLARSVERLRTEIGRPAAGIAWPYGEYDRTLVETAAALGMRYHLTLDTETTRLDDLPRINRTTLKRYRTLSDFADALTRRSQRREQLRFVEVDLAYFAGKERAAQEQLLSQLLSRLQVLRVNAVLIYPFTADGQRAFFHNTVMPVETDVLGRVVQQITRRTEIYHVYLRIPPPGAGNERLYADLARYNWFSDVVMEGRPEPAQVSATRALLRQYKPALKLGVRQGVPGQGADFALAEIAAGAPAEAVAREATTALASYPRVLFLIRRGTNPAEAALRDAMQTLRSAGVAHYGYAPDDFLNDAPPALRIVNALTEHTITSAGR